MTGFLQQFRQTGAVKQDAIRIRQELGWSERKISDQKARIMNYFPVLVENVRWLVGNNTPIVVANSPLVFNKVYNLDCLDGLVQGQRVTVHSWSGPENRLKVSKCGVKS